YLQGWYGQAPGQVNAELRRKAVGGEDLIDQRPADLIPSELQELKDQIGGLAQCDEDVLTYAMFPDQAKTYLQQRHDGNLQPEPLEPRPVNNAGGKVATRFKITVH